MQSDPMQELCLKEYINNKQRWKSFKAMPSVEHIMKYTVDHRV